jgi:hypothetical protein
MDGTFHLLGYEKIRPEFGPISTLKNDWKVIIISHCFDADYSHSEIFV